MGNADELVHTVSKGATERYEDQPVVVSFEAAKQGLESFGRDSLSSDIRNNADHAGSQGSEKVDGLDLNGGIRAGRKAADVVTKVCELRASEEGERR